MSRLQRVLLGAVLFSALVLRAVGVDQDLRRGSPTPDELSNFAGPVLSMWAARSPNPTVNGGYPGLFNWLAFLPMGLGAHLGGEAGAVLAGRVMVAGFSTLNVLLVFLLVRPAFGPGAALLGAALLAVSRSEVSEAHFLTPDVLVVSAFLLMLILARRPGASGVGPGVCAGAGIAVKYSGVLLLPALAAEYAAERRWRPLLVAAAAVGVAFAAAAPFALLWRHSQARGISELVAYYFGPRGGGGLLRAMTGQLAEVVGWIRTNLGPAALALVPAAAFARPRRALAGPLAALVAALGVLAFTAQVYPRHVLLASAATTLLAAAGWSALTQRLAVGAAGQALLAALVLFVPASRAAAVARGYAQATDLDRAAAWIEAQPAPARVATSLGRLRLDGAREVRAALALWDVPAPALAHFDLLVTPRDVTRRLQGVRIVQSFAPAGWPDASLDVVQPLGPLPSPWPAPVATSASAQGAERLWDGDTASAWNAPAGPGFIEGAWARAQPLVSIEVLVPPGEGNWPQRLTLLGRQGSGPWRPLPLQALRPGRARLQQEPHGQVYVVTEPVALEALRIERKAGVEWAIAEVRMRGPGVDERPPQ